MCVHAYMCASVPYLEWYTALCKLIFFSFILLRNVPFIDVKKIFNPLVHDDTFHITKVKKVLAHKDTKSIKKYKLVEN